MKAGYFEADPPVHCATEIVVVTVVVVSTVHFGGGGIELF